MAGNLLLVATYPWTHRPRCFTPLHRRLGNGWIISFCCSFWDAITRDSILASKIENRAPIRNQGYSYEKRPLVLRVLKTRGGRFS